MNKRNIKYIACYGVIIISVVLATLLDNKYPETVPQNFVLATQVLVTSIITLLSILSALYFVYVQIYLNRYPSNLVGKGFNIPVLNFAICTLISTAIGIYALACSSKLYFHMAFWTISFLLIIALIIFTFESKKLLSISFYIKQYVTSVRNTLETYPDKAIIKSKLSELYQIYEECVSKQEFYVAKIIGQSTEEIFNDLLKEINALIIEKKLEEKQALEIGKLIFSRACKHMNSLSNVEDTSFEETIIYAPISYLLTCCSIGQYTLYKEFVSIITSKIFMYQRQFNQSKVDKLYVFLEDIADELLVQSDKSEWIEHLLNELFTMTIVLNYANNSTGLKPFTRLITYCLMKNTENETFNKMFDVFEKFTIGAANTAHDFDEIVIYYAGFSNKILETKDEGKIDKYIGLLDHVQNNLIGDNKWTDYLFYFISELSEAMPDRYKQEMRQKNISVLSDLISLEENALRSVKILMPNYIKDVKEKATDIAQIQDICDDFRYLCSRAIRRNNSNIYYIFLESMNHCILSLQISNRQAQEELFKIYDYVLYLVGNVNNKVFSEMTLSMLQALIEKLDKDRKISKELGYSIIKTLTAHASHGDYITDFMRNYIIETLRNWYCEDDELKTFIISDIEAKNRLIKSIYLIGLDCIEYGKEESLRKVSNSLGWALIRSMQRSENDAIIRTITRLVQNIYKISSKMNITPATQLFLLTLFTTVGTFCETSPPLLRYQISFISFLSQESYDLVVTATQMRTSENDTWDSLFDNKTKIFTDRLLKKVREYSKPVKSSSAKQLSTV